MLTEDEFVVNLIIAENIHFINLGLIILFVIIVKRTFIPGRHYKSSKLNKQLPDEKKCCEKKLRTLLLLSLTYSQWIYISENDRYNPPNYTKYIVF